MDPIESHLSPIIRLFPRFSPIPSFSPSRRLIVSLLFQLTVMIVPFRYRNSNLRGQDETTIVSMTIENKRKRKKRGRKDIDRNNIPEWTKATLEYIISLSPIMGRVSRRSKSNRSLSSEILLFLSFSFSWKGFSECFESWTARKRKVAEEEKGRRLCWLVFDERLLCVNSRFFLLSFFVSSRSTRLLAFHFSIPIICLCLIPLDSSCSFFF